MKIIHLLLFVLICTYSFGQIKSPSKADQAFIDGLEHINDNELWGMRAQAQDKFQGNLVFGTVVTGWGLSALGTGAIFMASSNEDIKSNGPAFIGAGLGITIIGAIITSSAAKHRKRDSWMEQELWIRNQPATITLRPGSIKLTFGK